MLIDRKSPFLPAVKDHKDHARTKDNWKMTEAPILYPSWTGVPTFMTVSPIGAQSYSLKETDLLTDYQKLPPGHGHPAVH